MLGEDRTHLLMFQWIEINGLFIEIKFKDKRTAWQSLFDRKFTSQKQTLRKHAYLNI